MYNEVQLYHNTFFDEDEWGMRNCALVTEQVRSVWSVTFAPQNSAEPNCENKGSEQNLANGLIDCGFSG